MGSLPADEARAAVLVFTYRTVSGGLRAKTVFVSYVPDSLPVKTRMLSVATSGGLAKALGKINAFHSLFHAGDHDTLAVDDMLKRVSKFELDSVDTTVAVCTD